MKTAKLVRAFHLHSDSLRQTLEILKEPAPDTLDKVPWSEVKKAADQVAKQATTAGILWGGSPTIEESMDQITAYANELHGFILLCHGTTVRAGRTFLSSSQHLAERLVNTSLALLNTALSVDKKDFDRGKDKKALPVLVGCVWEVCTDIKKAPSNNCAAIGRCIVQVATSIKDVLREVKEAEESGPSNEGTSQNIKEVSDNSEDDNDILTFDTEFTAAEIKVVSTAKGLFLSTLEIVKQLLYLCASAPETSESIINLETILEDVQALSKEIDELGASLYPPQETSAMSATVQRINILVLDIKQKVGCFTGSWIEPLNLAFESLCVSENALNSVLSSS